MSVPVPTTPHKQGSQITNYARIGHVSQQLFSEILQELLTAKEPQNKLYGDVNSNKYLSKSLRAYEWVLINNVRTQGFVKFDIPLIYKLIRNLNLVAPPTQGWDFPNSPTPAELLPGDDIERIRRTRNEILHRGNCNVSDKEFTVYFQSFKDIAGRLELYLGKANGVFVSRIEFLESCSLDDKTENEYLQRLQNLAENEINLAKVVEELRNNVDKMLNKDMHVLKIHEWEEQNKMFVKTTVVDFVLQTLKDNTICTVIGSCGVGKSATIHHVALYLRDTEGYCIIPCHGPSDIEKYFLNDKKQVFIVDDVCGRYTAIQTDIEEWLKQMDSIELIMRKANVKVLASCRLQVFNEKQFKRLECFIKNSCNLSSETFSLSNEQQVQIALQYIPDNVVKAIKDIFSKCEFLPLMFALYKQLNKKNKIVDVECYFKNPFQKYSEEIDELKKLNDKTKYFALFMLVINNGTIDISDFMSEETDMEKQRRKQIFESCEIPRSTLRERIIEQLECLDNLFIKSILTKSQNKAYTTIHDKLFDYLCFYFGTNLQTQFVKSANFQLIQERTQLDSLSTELKKEFTILINAENKDECIKRYVFELVYGDCRSALYSRQLEHEHFRSFVCKYLNKSMTDDKIVSKRLNTLLIIGCEIGYADIVRILIENGANINSRDSNKDTPLIMACRGNNAEIVKLLVERGGDVNMSNQYGETPLISACYRDDSNIVKCLVEQDAKVNISGRFGYTPLIWACYRNNDEIIRLIIDKVNNVNVANCSGITPLMWACHRKNLNIVKLLTDKGADVTSCDSVGDTPLIITCRGDNDEIVNLLLDKGADVNAANFNNETPLICACRVNNDKSIKKLLDKNADVNVRDINGMSSLMYASKSGCYSIVNLLIENGADVSTKNTEGKTVEMFAKESLNEKTIKLIHDVTCENEGSSTSSSHGNCTKRTQDKDLPINPDNKKQKIL